MAGKQCSSDRAAAGGDGHVVSDFCGPWSTKKFHPFAGKRRFTKLTSTQLTEKIEETEEIEGTEEIEETEVVETREVTRINNLIT